MRTSRLTRVLLPLLALSCGSALSSCGGGEFQAGNAAGSGGMASSGGGGKGGATSGGTNGSGGRGGMQTSGPCPSKMPSAGDACTTPNLECTYGDDPRPSCRSHASCDGLTWQAGSDVGCSLDSSCPTTPPESGSDCLSIDQICVYPSEGSICGCPTCPSFCTSERWVCAPPPSGNCPTLLPNAGEPCSGNATCQYGSCQLGEVMQTRCQDESWVWEALACPATAG